MNEWMQTTTEYWQSGGRLLLPIALVSFGIWGLFLRSRSSLRNILSQGTPIAAALNRGTLGQDAEQLHITLTDRPGGISALLQNALRDNRQGTPLREAFTAREHECLQYLRRDFILLTALTAAAPLLGLLGTVMGMVQTFDAAAGAVGGTESRVALGISRALITTQFGLVVALPGLFGLAYLKRLIRQVQTLMATCRVYALTLLENPAPRGNP